MGEEGADPAVSITSPKDKMPEGKVSTIPICFLSNFQGSGRSSTATNPTDSFRAVKRACDSFKTWDTGEKNHLIFLSTSRKDFLRDVEKMTGETEFVVTINVICFI